MNFPSIKQQKSYRTLFHSDLLVVECKFDRIQFVIFNFDNQDLLKNSSFLFKDFSNQLSGSERETTLQDVYSNILKKTQEFVEVKTHSMILKIKLSKAQELLSIELPFIQTKISPNESISYLKQYSKAKQDFYKCEILRLKTKIYSLMTDVEDATNLIRSQSLQTKNSREKIKNLKQQLKILQDEKKKQQENFFIEVGVQHQSSSQRSDIIEWLQCPEAKQFSMDEEKLKNLTRFIQQQIKENQKLLSLSCEALPDGMNSMTRPSSEGRTGSQSKEIKGEPKRMSYSPQKVCFFEKSSERFRLQDYSLKTLEYS